MRDSYQPLTEPIPDPGSAWHPRYPAGSGGPAAAARRRGLRRLSKLTWRAALLSAVSAAGFAAVFAHAAHAQTVGSPAPVRPASGPAMPSPGPAHGKAHREKHHRGAAEPAAAQGQDLPAATPAPTLAPPATPPAPAPPSPAPAQTTSSGSV